MDTSNRRPKENAVMPMSVPPVASESDGLIAFLAQQRAAVRNAAYGLTDDQARMATTASILSIGGLIKHLAKAEQGWTERIVGSDTADPTDYGAYLAQFHMGPDETLADVLALYEEAAARADAVLADIDDLDQDVVLAKGVPWFPESATVRWVALHLIEETARHAGHADIIRESLDGASAGALMAAVEGWPPSDWVQPWTSADSPV
jgi:uncharacterized damage-inducible protein DinB